MSTIRLRHPPNGTTPITTPKRNINKNGRQKPNSGRDQGVYGPVARQVPVQLYPRGPDDHARADDDEDQVGAARDVRPEEEAEYRVEEEAVEEAAAEGEAALKRGAVAQECGGFCVGVGHLWVWCVG